MSDKQKSGVEWAVEKSTIAKNHDSLEIHPLFPLSFLSRNFSGIISRHEMRKCAMQKPESEIYSSDYDDGECENPVRKEKGGGGEKANKLSLHYTKNVRQLIILCALSRSLASHIAYRLDRASVLSYNQHSHGQNV